MTNKNFAKYELQTALLDGLFESTRKVKDGHLRLRQIEKYYDHQNPDTGKLYPNAIYLRLRVPYLLNPQAESLLLAILKLSGKGGLIIDPTQPFLPFLMNPENEAKYKNIGAAITTEYEILKESGMGKGKEDYRLMRLYLEQMAEIRVHYSNKATGWKGSDWFLQYKIHTDGQLIVQINWRLAGAIFGEYLHAEINLHERHVLKKDASKTLHRWLSAHLWAGKSGYLLYKTLLSHIWTEKATPSTERKRLQRLKQEILPDIGQLSKWAIEMGKDGATIKREKK